MDRKNLPRAPFSRSEPLFEQEVVERKQQIEKLSNGLSESREDPNKRNLSASQFYDIVNLALEIAEEDYEYAAKSVCKNMQKVRTHLTRQVVDRVLELADKDPQIDEMRKVVDICRSSYGFKQLGDVPEIKSERPKWALNLLQLSLNYSYDDGTPHYKQYEADIRRSISALDPQYPAPQDNHLGIH